MSKLLWGVPLWIWVAVGVCVAGIVLYFALRKPDYSKETKVEDADGDGKPDNFDPGPYTDRLKADLDGISMGHDIPLHLEVLGLSNGRLHAIYDDWNRRVKGTGGGFFTNDWDTLPKAIADEYSEIFSSWGDIKQKYQKRFDELGLR